MKHDFDVFKMRVKEALKTEWKKYIDHEVQWNVSNQFNESYLESAYDNFANPDGETAQQCYAAFNAEIPTNIMTLAYWASTFEVEPLAAGWTQ
jgi:hypothetical protein